MSLKYICLDQSFIVQLKILIDFILPLHDTIIQFPGPIFCFALCNID